MSSVINAGTAISDIIVPEVYFNYTEENTKELVAFLNSGVMTPDQTINQFLGGGGTTFNVPFFKDIIDPDDVNISSDAFSTKATYDKITAAKQIGVRLERNKLLASADLTASFAGADPMKRIANRIEPWWARHLQRTALAVSRAIIDHSVAGGTGATAGDLVNDIYSDVVPGSITAAMLISEDAILDALQTAGDASDMFTTIAVHSVVRNNMRKSNTGTGRSAFVDASDSNVGFDTYLGRRLIVDDGLTVVTGSNSPQYYTYIYRGGALSSGSSMPKVPIAMTRDEEAGAGGGAEGLVTRKLWCIHPNGYSWTGSASGATPSNAELADDTKWTRVFNERKQVGIAALLSNG